MKDASNSGKEAAKKLMDEFSQRTGLSGSGGDIRERYLWTDAFAVQTFFALSHSYPDNDYYNLALKLIDEVHLTLGKFGPNDERKGWISGLSEDVGKKHPTAAGLRIGKKLPERKSDETFN